MPSSGPTPPPELWAAGGGGAADRRAGGVARPGAGGDRPTRPPEAGPADRQGWASAGPGWGCCCRVPADGQAGPRRPAAGRPPSDRDGRQIGSRPPPLRIGPGFCHLWACTAPRRQTARSRVLSPNIACLYSARPLTESNPPIPEAIQANQLKLDYEKTLNKLNQITRVYGQDNSKSIQDIEELRNKLSMLSKSLDLTLENWANKLQ